MLTKENKMPVIYALFAVCCCAVYVLYASYFNSFGTTAAHMMDFFHIGSADQGFILTIQAIGGILITVVLAFFGERMNKIYTLVTMVLLMTLAALAIGTMTFYTPEGSGYITMLVFVFVAGIGICGIDILMNSVISDVYGEKKAVVLPLSHAFYGLGSMSAPFIISSLLRADVASDFSLPFLVIGCLSVVVLLLFGLTGKKLMPQTVYATQPKVKEKQNPAEIFKYGKAWMILAAAILYFCFQIGIATWLPTYCGQDLNMDSQLSGLMATLFFGGALVMRFLVPLFLKKMKPVTYYVACCLLSFVCMAVCFAVSNMWVVIVLTVLGGFLQGGVVTVLFLYATDSFPKRSASASAMVVLAVSIGTFVSPLVMGSMAEASGFRLPMYFITACMLLSAVLIGIQGAIDKKALKSN